MFIHGCKLKFVCNCASSVIFPLENGTLWDPKYTTFMTLNENESLPKPAPLKSQKTNERKPSRFITKRLKSD